MLVSLGYPGVKHKSTRHFQSLQSYWGKSSKGVHEVKQKVKERCQSPLFPLRHSLLVGIKSGLTGLSFSTAAAAAKSLQSCPTLCDPIDGSPPGSPVPGILQARTLEWVAISFSTTNTLKTFDLKRNFEIATLPAFNPFSMLPFSFVNSEIIPHTFP